MKKGRKTKKIKKKRRGNRKKGVKAKKIKKKRKRGKY